VLGVKGDDCGEQLEAQRERKEKGEEKREGVRRKKIQVETAGNEPKGEGAGRRGQ